MGVDEGAWISEAVLWVTWAHQGMLTCNEDTHLCTLCALEFQTIVSRFQYSGSFDPRQYARQFAALLMAPEKSLTDIMDPAEMQNVVRLMSATSPVRRPMHDSIGSQSQH